MDALVRSQAQLLKEIRDWIVGDSKSDTQQVLLYFLCSESKLLRPLSSFSSIVMKIIRCMKLNFQVLFAVHLLMTVF
jgi:hypothetical protein